MENDAVELTAASISLTSVFVVDQDYIDRQETKMKPNVTDDQRELFAHRLEELMASQSMSQSDLARAVWPVENMTFRPDHTGKYHQVYGRDRISCYVRGTIPNRLTLQRIARVLKVDPDYLVPLRTSGVAPIPTLQRPVALMSITNEGTPPRHGARSD